MGIEDPPVVPPGTFGTLDPEIEFRLPGEEYEQLSIEDRDQGSGD